MSSRWQESSINTLKMVITFTQMKNPGPKCIWKEIPKEKPSGPFGETNILPGCGSPCRKPWTKIISANTSTKAFATYDNTNKNRTRKKVKLFY